MKNHDYTKLYFGHDIFSQCGIGFAGKVGMAGSGLGIEKGDTLTLMEHGKVAKYEVLTIKFWAEWSDRWSMDAQFIGYVDSAS